LGKKGWKKTVTVPAKKAHQKANDPEVRRSLYRAIWARLHSAINGDKDFVDLVLGTMPVSCPCKRKADDLLKRFPPRYKSEKDWFEWTVEFHNAVSGELLEQKPQIDMDRAYMLWRNRRPNSGRSRAIITVANGSHFLEILKLTRPLMQDYADRVNADFIDLDNDTEEWGPMEKFRVWNFAKEYEEVLFVDADVVIKPNAPNIFEQYNESICVYDEYSDYKNREWLTRERKAVSTLSGLNIENQPVSFNSGVILSRKSSCDIWKRPNVDIGTTHCAEQIWIGEQIRKEYERQATLGKLDSRWNWQYWFGDRKKGEFENGLEDAYFVHFSNCPSRLESIRKYIDQLNNKDLVWPIITWDKFTSDTLSLSQIILDKHPDVSGIAGVPRSGMRAACDISMRLGVPLYEITADGLRYIGGGSRIESPETHGKRIEHTGSVVVIDDSTCSGKAFDNINTDLPFYVVYAGNHGRQKVTGYAVSLDWPHLFDWNLLNNGYILRNHNVGIDFDGVLCEDCPLEDDDDGPRYQAWMTTRKPIRTPRDYTVPYIITARREAYRDLTEEWLKRYRISYGMLVMYPGTLKERNRNCIGSWKAAQCQKFNVKWFVESSYQQAQIISKITKRPVISIEQKPNIQTQECCNGMESAKNGKKCCRDQD
jgi:hypothetical protein